MDTLTCQRPTWLGTQLNTVYGRAARIPGMRAVAPSCTAPNAQDRARTSSTDYDLAPPSPAIIAVGLALMMATAMAAACSVVYTPSSVISGINAQGVRGYTDDTHHRRLSRVR